MKSTIFKHHKLSKYIYPTEIKRNGLKGTLIVGRKSAKDALAKMLGRGVDDSFRESDTAKQWIFSEPLENFRKFQNTKKRKVQKAKQPA